MPVEAASVSHIRNDLFHLEDESLEATLAARFRREQHAEHYKMQLKRVDFGSYPSY